jgi:hypothetical protein
VYTALKPSKGQFEVISVGGLDQILVQPINGFRRLLIVLENIQIVISVLRLWRAFIFFPKLDFFTNNTKIRIYGTIFTTIIAT